MTYLQKREAHMQYPIYQEAGWPIGSGSVESAAWFLVVWGAHVHRLSHPSGAAVPTTTAQAIEKQPIALGLPTV